MSHVHAVTPDKTSVPTGVKAPAKVAEALSDVLSATYDLMIRTHEVHWNIEGPLFYSVHMLTEDQYGALFEAADVIAERIRALGRLTPMSPAALVDDTGEEAQLRTAGEMIEALKTRHEALARLCHDGIALAEEARDPVSADLLTARSAAHEKAAWMLRALSAQ